MLKVDMVYMIFEKLRKVQTKNATKEKIIERFRELTLKYHSDRGGSDDKLKKIIEAKEILLNNKKKK